ncbi:MAG: lipoprotein-releasing ABC transporter permease subunit [Gammaproteobacteria bacterium]|nr:lipoprotein-releasing ABC transporter permease subunit [Gammaproteobacteria bacterium]MCP5135268.1 lipoprotein-releasing ABC transporter permease subunit [Gammaproteobacteria bacterium]
MFRPLALFIGLRYTGAKRRNHFISFISATSMIGIALGVTALITVLSVMNGFQTELRSRILSMAAHGTINGVADGLRDWRFVQETVSKHPEVVGAAPFVERQGMLSNGKRVSGIMVRGILPSEEPKVSDILDEMKLGSLDDLQPGAFNIVLGVELAAKLNVYVGSKVTLVAPQLSATPVGVAPRFKRFTVSGLFEVGMYEYDSGLALIHMDDAATLYRMGDEVTGVRMKITDMFRAPWVVREAARGLPDTYYVTDWTRKHANFFKAIRTEKTVMFVILMLIVAVAAFNIVSTLVMVVTDKQSDIAILRTLGLSPGRVMAIFTVQGTVIGVIGTLLGLIGGVALALNVETIVPAIEQAFGVQFMPADVYYISELPSELHVGDVIWICGMSLALSLLATLYPAWRASRTQPAEALRYE